ncbi:MAG: HNH endonuclease [Melioribacteraceae bacterium]
MLIKQIMGSIYFWQNQNDFLASIEPWEGIYWEKHPIKGNTAEISRLKFHIRSALKSLQGCNCAYCGLPFYETSNDEIEHIAPKGTLRDGTKLNPEFTFVGDNLVLACRLCNGFLKKGTKDTVDIKVADYKHCKFKLVHPYFDDPDLHYEFTSTFEEVLIQYKSSKGKFSIELFDLASTAQTEGRAKLNNKKKYESLSQSDKDMIEKTFGYKP